ncbi:hypothetical protein UlMin_015654 [Ulmus minor]
MLFPPSVSYSLQDGKMTALEKASICMLNCVPTGSKTLKNLVLGGLGSITVADVHYVSLVFITSYYLALT